MFNIIINIIVCIITNIIMNEIHPLFIHIVVDKASKKVP
jgi:hypothetical protein